MRKIIGSILASLWLLVLIPPIMQSARAQDCNTAASETVYTITIQGAPHTAISTKDGCTIFLSISSQPRGQIAVLQRSSGKISLTHDVQLAAGQPAGIALSHDNKLLAVPNGKGALLFDTVRLAAGDATPLATATDQGAGGPAGASHAAITPDDKLLFISDEGAATITVYDIVKLRGGDATAIGRIPVAPGPVGLAISPDGRTLYVTSEMAAPKTMPASCHSETDATDTPPGILTIVDVAKAARTPEVAVSAQIPAGCDPVRVVLSADGARAFVTARGQNTLQVFDTARIASDPAHALLASIPVGQAPVGVTLAGGKVIVANSNRFAAPGRKGEWLSVIDPAADTVIGDIPSGVFPRELNVTPDGKTLLVTNFNSSSLQLVDLARLTPEYYATQEPLRVADDAEKAKAKIALAARISAGQASPGTEAALRKIISELESGTVEYETLGADLANAVRPALTNIQDTLKKWGPLQSMSFSTITPQNADVFIVTFGQIKTRWTIQLAPDGKIDGLFFSPVQ